MFWNKHTLTNLTILLTAVAVGLMCSTVLAKKPPRPPKPPETPPDPAIVYNDGGSIFVMDADGSNQTLVLTYAGSSLSLAPNWSPDGTHISFNGRYDNPLPHGIYTVNIDASEPTLLAPVENWWDTTGAVWSPVPTPDGEYKLLFVSRPVVDADGNGFTDLFLMNTDGTGLVNLTNTPDRSETGPTWAPTGDSIAVVAYETCCDADNLLILDLGIDENGALEIVTETNMSYLAEVAGNALPSDLKWLDWAKTQDKIAMTLSSPDSGQDIWVLDLATYDLVQLTGIDFGANSGERQSTWSPDDSQIAFFMSGGRGKDKGGIFVMNADGSGVTKLNRRGRNPDWWRNWVAQ